VLPTATKPNLYEIDPSQLHASIAPIVETSYRAKQIEQWLFDRGVESFGEMTNLPKDLRERLSSRFDIALPHVKKRTDPAPDGSEKYLFELRDGQMIESVYMPMGERTSLCLSSQAGCAVGCTFCVTGFFGGGRNLTAGEIAGQYLVIRNEKQIPPELTNIVFMGMGEPLLNIENVFASLEILYRQIASKRVTLSTSGIIPGIDQLAQLDDRPNLAVSINAPDRRRREEIMPITRKYPLEDLIDALRRFPLERGRTITAEYVLIAGYNDSPEDARSLVRLLHGVRAKVNAIPLNEDANLPAWMKRPDDRAIDRFVDVLADHGLTVTVRRSKGRAIAAACGQLRGRELPKRRARRNP
jgi:23S rRNA (adenine2503-C2)-methyltransferase